MALPASAAEPWGCTHQSWQWGGQWEKSWQNPNVCLWAGIWTNNKPQHLQTANMEKDVYFGVRTDVGKDHCVHSQSMVCDGTHFEQEPLSLGQVAESRCWIGRWGWHQCPDQPWGSPCLAELQVGRKATAILEIHMGTAWVISQRAQHVANYCVKKRHWFTI